MHETTPRYDLIKMSSFAFRLLLPSSFWLLIFIPPHGLAHEDIIYWWRESSPPMHISEGDSANHGWGDLMFEEIKKILPENPHEYFDSNMLRMYYETKVGKTICAFLYKTALREGFLSFSKPTAIFPGQKLYFSRKDSLRAYKIEPNTTRISLTKLAEAKKGIKIGIAEQRSYGSAIDKIITQHPNAFTTRLGNDSTLGIFNMFLAGRTDAIIEYPWRFSFLRASTERSEEYVGYYIEETPGYEPGYLACSKTPKGEMIIASANKNIKTIRTVYAQLLMAWLPEDIRQAYKESSEKYFSQR
jgi:uncharacterized protein (TIGR02285 family)